MNPGELLSAMTASSVSGDEDTHRVNVYVSFSSLGLGAV